MVRLRMQLTLTDILKIIKISTYSCLIKSLLYASYTNLINTEYDTLTIIIHPTVS